MQNLFSRLLAEEAKRGAVEVVAAPSRSFRAQESGVIFARAEGVNQCRVACGGLQGQEYFFLEHLTQRASTQEKGFSSDH